jgi:hypothetical protein
MHTIKLLLILALCSPAFAAVTLVQKAAGAYFGNTNPFTAAFTNNTVGDLAVVAVKWCSATGTPVTISSVADTNTNTWTISSASLATITATHYANCNTEFAYAASLKSYTGTNTVSVTFSATAGSGSIGIFELSAGVLDQTNTGTNANTNVPTPGSITTGTAGSFYVAAGVLDDGFGFASGWFTAGSPFTLNTENGGGNMNVVDEYYAQTSAGAQAATFGTNESGVTGPNAGSVITFKPSGGGGVVNPPHAGIF